MKINYKFAFILSLIFNLAFIGTLGYRMINKKHYPGNRSGRERQTMKEWLDLTDEQEVRIEQIRDNYSPKYRVVRDSIYKVRAAHAQKFTFEDPDTASMFAHLEEVGRLQAEMERIVIRQMLDESSVLTPEQRTTFMKRVKERMNRRSRSHRRSSESQDSQRPPEKEQTPQMNKEKTP